MRHLSKSKLLAYRQCHKRLWLEIHRPQLRVDSRGTEASFRVGHQVGDIARALYDPKGTGVLIDAQRDGYDKAREHTQVALNAAKPIFEAAFFCDGALALADVLLPVKRRGKRAWRMVEVKSSTEVKDYHRDDTAIQAFVAKGAGVPLDSVALAYIDSQWVYPGQGDYQGLLVEEDLTEQAMGRAQEVADWIGEAQAIAEKKREPTIETGRHCTEPFACGFFAHCASQEQQAEYPVTWLPRRQQKPLCEYIKEHTVTDLRKVPNELLNAQQLRVKKHTLSGTVFFNKKGAAGDLSSYGLPAYFLDFETVQLAVPLWKGTRPYQQIPFQYSLHRLARNGDMKVQGFLDLSGNDPSKCFAQSLIDQCGKTGPIYVYNAGFEKSRISELASRFTKLKAELLNLNARIVDLLPIARDRYYHPSQEGSWSIKKVLPAIAPELDYQTLDGVQDGGMAMEVYHEAINPTTTQARKNEIELQLRAYCERDTFALVKLWEFFMGKTKKLGKRHA